MAIRIFTRDRSNEILTTDRYPAGTHFRAGEFNTGDAPTWKIADPLIDILETIRRVIGHPVHISSGFRAADSDSLHSRGCAADIGVQGFSSWELGGLALALGHGTWDNQVGGRARKGGAGIAYLGAASMSHVPNSLIHISVPNGSRGSSERMYVYRTCDHYSYENMNAAELSRIQNEARRWQARVQSWTGQDMAAARPWNLQDPAWIVCPGIDPARWGFTRAPAGYAYPAHDSGAAMPASGYQPSAGGGGVVPGAGRSETTAGPIAGILGVGLGILGLMVLL